MIQTFLFVTFAHILEKGFAHNIYTRLYFCTKQRKHRYKTTTFGFCLTHLLC